MSRTISTVGAIFLLLGMYGCAADMDMGEPGEGCVGAKCDSTAPELDELSMRLIDCDLERDSHAAYDFGVTCELTEGIPYGELARFSDVSVRISSGDYMSSDWRGMYIKEGYSGYQLTFNHLIEDYSWDPGSELTISMRGNLAPLSSDKELQVHFEDEVRKFDHDQFILETGIGRREVRFVSVDSEPIRNKKVEIETYFDGVGHMDTINVYSEKSFKSKNLWVGDSAPRIKSVDGKQLSQPILVDKAMVVVLDGADSFEHED